MPEPLGVVDVVKLVFVVEQADQLICVRRRLRRERVLVVHLRNGRIGKRRPVTFSTACASSNRRCT